MKSSFQYNGKHYVVGPIPEQVYEDFIDYAYGRGDWLGNTKLWKKEYRTGFVCPDGNGGYHAFAEVNGKCLYLGTYNEDETFEPEVPEWEDMMLEKAYHARPREQMRILREILLMGEHTPLQEEMANDSEVAQFIEDYWAFVVWNEHGNQSTLDEVGFYPGMLEMILDIEPYHEYLSYEPNLWERLCKLHQKYAGRSADANGKRRLGGRLRGKIRRRNKDA